MHTPKEGYVLHTYGPERFVHHAAASVMTLRRHDAHRPAALFCPDTHREHLRKHGKADLFEDIHVLPEEHASITGFKHHLHRFMPYERTLFVDADIIWCRSPDPLWKQLQAYPFTATGNERADFFFGGPKDWRIMIDVILNRRQRTIRRFGITHLPRVQAGMIYCADRDTVQSVCETAASFLAKRAQTHFRSRLAEGRSEESCEWSLAMAMSQHNLEVFPWLQGRLSPQLDFIEDWTTYDPDFRDVTYRYYTDRSVYALRGIRNRALRTFLTDLVSGLPGRGDYQEFTPVSLHFSWLHYKQPFQEFAERMWAMPAQPHERTATATQ
ncbi:MAG: hypothetical protein F4Y00_10650 [Bacteroidetes bacterium SB0662_bin_6]|nr:hypothetical protein [Bacteroidetes bacterium SB0668_bin_1]MYE05414.1 hypothetical protein [Bacteroidetes bacterium SB0662_bin_6]